MHHIFILFEQISIVLPLITLYADMHMEFTCALSNVYANKNKDGEEGVEDDLADVWSFLERRTIQDYPA